MSECPWKLDGTLASCASGPFAARIELRRPQQGILLAVAGDRWELQLLRIAAPAADFAEIPLLEGHIRHGELLAAYRETSGWPVQIAARWKVVPVATAPEAIVFELLLSVHTDKLDSRPELIVSSRLPAAEVTGLAHSDLSRSGDVGADLLREFENQSVPSCFLYRFAQSGWSAVEMALPQDTRVELVPCNSGPARTGQVRYHAFAQPLEKGVILCSRLRAALLPRDRDLELARLLYKEFALSDLPLQA